MIEFGQNKDKKKSFDSEWHTRQFINNYDFKHSKQMPSRRLDFNFKPLLNKY